MNPNGYSGYSFDDALQNVGRNLVYDPKTKQLRIGQQQQHAGNSNILKRRGSIDSGASKCTLDFDSGLSSESPTENSSYTIDEDNLPDLCFNDENQEAKASKASVIQSLLHRIVPATAAGGESTESSKAVDDDEHDESLATISKVHVKRPANLPPKDIDEERKHVAAFNEIVKQAKRKEAKENKIRKRLLSQQHRQEDEVSEAIRCWSKEILPAWPTSHRSKRARDLWWNGIPAPVRDKVWPLAIGNELNITEELYRICVERSKEKIWTKQFVGRRSSNPTIPTLSTQTHRRAISSTSHAAAGKQSKEIGAMTQMFDDKLCLAAEELEDEEDKLESVGFLIKLDVLRTFPQLGLFHEHGPYHQALRDILAAYVVYRPDLGFCQGMSNLAAMLLLNLTTPAQVFIAFANFLNNELLLQFYRLNQPQMQQVYRYYDQQLAASFPRLSAHFRSIGFGCDLYLVDQVYTLFSRALPFECACRVWDVYLRDGNEFFFRASLALLGMFEATLLAMHEFVDIARFLSKLPEECLDTDKYFDMIAKVCLQPPVLPACLATTTGGANHHHNHPNGSIIKKFLPFP